ncbi:MAG: hypothetical protein K1X74_19240 [Pirellulales bacterium]|nr:hypothetical protein [Pirellulales bacterium]
MWQALIGNWIKRRAQAQLYETLLNQAQVAAGAEASDSDSSEPAGPDRCSVGLVFAMGGELRGLQDRMEGLLHTRAARLKLCTGRFAGRRIAAVETGIGREAASRGTLAIVDGHTPDWIVSAGFAGSLQPELRRGDFLLANEIVDEQGARWSVDLKIPPEELAARRELHVGRLLTVDRVVIDPADKRRLGAEHGAQAVDMETSAVAEVCRQHRVRFLSVRVISDAVDDALPAEIEHISRPQSVVRKAGLALGSVVRRPGSAKDFWRLYRDGLEASDRLAGFLAGILPQLP